MRCTAEDVEVPEDLTKALQGAAAAVPHADLQPIGPVLRLGNRRRRRRQAATALTGAGAVAALALTVLALSPPAPEEAEIVVGAGTNTGAGQEASPSSSAPPDDGSPVFLPLAAADWLPDGTTRPVPRAQPDDGVTDALRLADGRTVTLATRDLRGGVEREDGALVEDVAFVMAVFDPDGSLLGQQDIRRVGGYIDLAGESGGKVVLARRESIGNCCDQRPLVEFSLIDPTSFTEEPLLGVDDAHGPADADDDRLVASSDPTVGGGGACRLHLVDLRDRQVDGNVPLPGCLDVHAVTLSPDGSQVAVVANIETGLGLYVVDIEQAQVVHTNDDLVDDPCTPTARRCGPTEVWALTWTADTTLDIVIQDPDPSPNGTIDTGLLVPTRLRTLTTPTTP